MTNIKLRAVKVGRYYRLRKEVNNKVVAEIDHNFKNWQSAAIYGNRIDNPILSNYIPKDKRPYDFVELSLSI